MKTKKILEKSNNGKNDYEVKKIKNTVNILLILEELIIKRKKKTQIVPIYTYFKTLFHSLPNPFSQSNIIDK